MRESIIHCYRLKDGSWAKFDIIARYQSIIWTRRFTDVGSFQLTLPDCPLVPNDIIVHGRGCAGFVMKVEKTSGKTTVYGYDLKGFAAFRMLDETDFEIAKGASVSDTVKGLATKYLATGKRAIEGLTVEENSLTEKFEEAISLSSCKISEAVSKCCIAAKLGWDIVWENGAPVFRLLKPESRSHLIFSRRRKNLDEASYVIDEYDAINTAAGEESDYCGILRREGAAVSEKKEYVKASSDSADIWGECALGDFITVSEYGFNAVVQITEVKTVYEPNRTITVPTFGESGQNLIKKLLG